MGTTQQICTGSADHDVKFWDVELKLDPEWSTTQKRLTLDCVRTLTMTDDVLAVKYSPDSKLLAVSLLDATVKVFYEDSLKFFLSLYVHATHRRCNAFVVMMTSFCMYYLSGA